MAIKKFTVLVIKLAVKNIVIEIDVELFVVKNLKIVSSEIFNEIFSERSADQKVVINEFFSALTRPVRNLSSAGGLA